MHETHFKIYNYGSVVMLKRLCQLHLRDVINAT